MSLNAFSNSLQCEGCGNGPRDDLWIDAFPGSLFEGLCTDCALEERGYDVSTKIFESSEVAPSAELVALRAPLESERASAETKLLALRAFTIATHAHKIAFGAALAEVQASWRRLDEREKLVTKPLLAELESARELFRGPKVGYKSLESCIKEKLAEYETRCALEVADATERAEQLAAAGNAAGAHAALASVREAPLDESAAIKHPWQWEVINLDLLPREFVLPNPRAIDAHMRASLGTSPTEAPVLPGVKFTRGLGKK